MKTLLLLRHGKSSWKDSNLADHDRPLKKRGREAVKRMGELLRDEKLVPQHILTSSAVRAVETTEILIKSAKYSGDVETVSGLYHADPKVFVAVVSRVSEHFESVLLVGHNPGLEEWLTQLIGGNEELATAALAYVELPVKSWSELTLETRGTLRKLWEPRLL